MDKLVEHGVNTSRITPLSSRPSTGVQDNSPSDVKAKQNIQIIFQRQ